MGMHELGACLAMISAGGCLLKRKLVTSHLIRRGSQMLPHQAVSQRPAG